jgi:hypothetical protein
MFLACLLARAFLCTPRGRIARPEEGEKTKGKENDEKRGLGPVVAWLSDDPT